MVVLAAAFDRTRSPSRWRGVRGTTATQNAAIVGHITSLLIVALGVYCLTDADTPDWVALPALALAVACHYLSKAAWRTGSD